MTISKQVFRIVYMDSVSSVPHEYTTDKLFDAKKRLEFLESQTAKDMLGIRVIRKEFDNAN